MTHDKHLEESFRDYLRRKEPNLPAIEKAIEEFKAGKPVTQHSVDTNERLVVEESKRLGFLLVRTGERVLYRARLEKEKDAPAPLTVTSEPTVEPQPNQKGVKPNQKGVKPIVQHKMT